MAHQNNQSSPATPNRLPSLRPPRDLTLSGAVPSNGPSLGSVKPKFAPNLAVAGKRTVPTTDERQNSQSNRGGKKPWRGGGRGGTTERNRRKYEPEIIQSKGIFSDGLAEGVGNKSNRDYEDLGGGSGGRSNSRTTVGGRIQRGDESADKSSVGGSAKVKSEAMETDEVALRNLLKDSIISDLREGKVRPVVLPFGTVKQEEQQTKRRIKSEPLTEFEQTTSIADEIFSSEEGRSSFVFVQLPSVLSDMMADQCLANNDFKPKEEIKTEIEVDEVQQEETGNNANCDKLKRPFENVPEGPLGKLQILKSGRVRLKLYTDNDERPIYFDVNIVPTTFSQELVSIHCDNPELNEGSMNVITDKILHKFLVTPNVEGIVNNLKR